MSLYHMLGYSNYLVSLKKLLNFTHVSLFYSYYICAKAVPNFSTDSRFNHIKDPKDCLPLSNFGRNKPFSTIHQ